MSWQNLDKNSNQHLHSTIVYTINKQKLSHVIRFMRCSQLAVKQCRLLSIVHVELPVCIVDPFEYRRIETTYHTESNRKSGSKSEKAFLGQSDQMSSFFVTCLMHLRHTNLIDR